MKVQPSKSFHVYEMYNLVCQFVYVIVVCMHERVLKSYIRIGLNYSLLILSRVFYAYIVHTFISSQGAALGTMVGWMTYGYKKFESVDTVMRQALPPLNDATQKLLPLIDQDSEAYTTYVEATKLPKKTEEEKTK